MKKFFYTVLATVTGFISPVRYSVYVLAFLCVANLLCGLVAGMLVKDERFEFRKALRCLVEVAIYVVIVASVFNIGDVMKDTKEALYVVKVVTYVMSYFYAENILKNLVLLFPGSRTFAFFHYWISLEFIKHVPALGRFLRKEKRI